MAALFLIFYIPTLIPGQFVASESYIFGYNNRIGILLVVLLTSIGAILLRKPGPQFPSVCPSDSVHRATFWTCISVMIAVGIGMYLLTSRLGTYGESGYLINRIEMASLGLRPYRDFEFAYGAGLIYGPLFLGHLLHLNVPNAYYLFWIINLGLGTWFLAEVVDQIDYPGQHRNKIFISLFLVALLSVIGMGTNGTGFRFAIAPLLGIVVFRTIRDGSMRSQIIGSFLLVIFTSLLLLISPETGVAFTLGASAFELMFYRRSAGKRWLLPYLGMLLLLALLLAAANYFQVFQTLKSYASGGYNFPIIPAPSILFFLFSLFICARVLESAISKGNVRSNYVFVLLISVPMISPALGRCDPFHLYWCGLSFLMIGFLWASANVRAWKYFCGAFTVIFIILGGLSGLWAYRGELARASVNLILLHADSSPWINRQINGVLKLQLGEKAAKAKIATLSLVSQQDASSDIQQIPSQVRGILEAPFGYGRSHKTTSLDFGYYWGITNVPDLDGVARKISELEQNPNRQLLLPEHYDRFCLVDPDATRIMIRFVFAYPFDAPYVNNQSVYQPLCAYISTRYVLAVPAQPETFGYEIWTPK